MLFPGCCFSFVDSDNWSYFFFQCIFSFQFKNQLVRAETKTSRPPSVPQHTFCWRPHFRGAKIADNDFTLSFGNIIHLWKDCIVSSFVKDTFRKAMSLYCNAKWKQTFSIEFKLLMVLSLKSGNFVRLLCQQVLCSVTGKVFASPALNRFRSDAEKVSWHFL